MIRALTTWRRYRQLCDQRPAGQEPQCWEAETEIGEAWRAMPRWLRIGHLLLPRPHWLDAVHEAWPRLGLALCGFRDGWREEYWMFAEDGEIVAVRDPAP